MNFINTKQDLQGSRLYGMGGLKMVQEDWAKPSKPSNKSNTKQKNHSKRA